MKALFLSAAVFALPCQAQEDSMPWQTDASFAALSNTAMSITGDIFLEGSEQEKTLTTENGTEIGLSFVEDRSSGWNLSDNEVWPGAIFAVDEDPGELQSGNTLCGSDAASYIVLTPIEDGIGGPFLQMAVFSEEAPENIESAGLCGTLNYALD